MLGIAIDLDGPELVALDQQRDRASRERVRRGKVHRLAENQVFRRFYIWVNRLIGLLGATGEPCESHRRAHQFKEAAPGNRIHPLLRRRGKLALHRGLKFGSVGQLIERAPVFLALRPFQLATNGLERHGLESRGPNSHGLRVRGLRRAVDSHFHRLLHRRRVLSLCAHRWHTSQLVRSFGVRIL